MFCLLICLVSITACFFSYFFPWVFVVNRKSIGSGGLGHPYYFITSLLRYELLDCIELEKTLPARDESKIKGILKGSNEKTSQ